MSFFSWLFPATFSDNSNNDSNVLPVALFPKTIPNVKTFSFSLDGQILIKQWEGFSLEAYPDPLSGGVPWTIGWGSTHGVYKGMVVNLVQAQAMFDSECLDDVNSVNAAIAGHSTSQHQFDAMVSFAYNEGIGALRSSSLLKYHQAGQFEKCADEFLVWDKGHVDGVLVEVAGLLNRRKAERNWYLTSYTTASA